MMEYACPVWHSSASAAVALALEGVQTRSPHYFDSKLGHAQRPPSSSNWLSHQWRRTTLIMTLFHQLVHLGQGLLAECMFQLSSSTGRSVRKPHQLILGHGLVNKTLKRRLFNCYFMEHAPGGETGHNEPQTLSFVTFLRRTLFCTLIIENV